MTYKKKTSNKGEPVVNQFTPINLQKAIAHAKVHPEEAIASVARRFEVNRTTLKRRLDGVQKPRNEAHQDQQLFSQGEEKQLALWCEEMHDVGFPVNTNLLREMAQWILNNRGEDHQLGVHWPQRYLSRHSELDQRFAYYQEKSRQRSGADEYGQRLFYRLLRSTIMRLKITPDRLWNCDEKGVTMGRITGKEKVIVRAGTRRPTIATDPSREFTSILETVNAAGEVLAPFIVWQGKTQRYGMYGWAGVHDQDATFTATESGYMDDEAGFEYMSEHFHPLTANKNKLARLLIVDGHSSHVYWRVIQYALNHDIHMICLPSHSTHLLQPLDVGCFGVFSKMYKHYLRQWTYKHPHQRYTKKEFWEVLVPTRDDTFTSQTIIAAFKASGCWPINTYNGAPTAPTPRKDRQVLHSQITSTPGQLKVLAKQLHQKLNKDNEVKDLFSKFEELSLGSILKWRDINANPKADTLRQLRSGKSLPSDPNALKFISKGRLLKRKEVIAGIERLNKQKEAAAEVQRKQSEKRKILGLSTPKKPQRVPKGRGKGKALPKLTTSLTFIPAFSSSPLRDHSTAQEPPIALEDAFDGLTLELEN